MAKEPHMSDLKAIIEAYNRDITEAPYATMKDGPDKYLFRKDNKQKLVGSADNEPEGDEEELEEKTMDKELRDMQIAAGIRVAEDCDVDVDYNDDGECSPFTHADDNVAMVREDGDTCIRCRKGTMEPGDTMMGPVKQCDRCGYQVQVNEDGFEEDLLLPPKDRDADGRYDGDVEGTYSGKTNFDDETFDDWTAKYPGEGMEEGADSDDPSAMECPGCGDIAFVKTGGNSKDEEFECESCGHYGIYSSLGEQGPGDDEDEFSYDDDAMVDLGDDDEYDFNDEFEREIGNTNRFESVVDMNELRRLAGLALVETEVADEELEEAELSDPSKNTHVGRAFASSEFVEEDGDESDTVAYEIADEKAYYAMADILGAELDFGPEDEVLVPAARNDEILVALARQGFKKGRDFEVASPWLAPGQLQLQDDLQNGYDDHTYTDGQDYFPKGATSQPAVDLGPTAGRAGDNPMSNKMRSIEKDDVYESMKLAYRRFRKA